MKIIEVVDEDGFKKRYQIQDDDDPGEAADIGLDISVPDTRGIDWEQVALELNNKLHDLRLFTINDVFARENGIGVAVRSVLQKRVKDLYKE